ncbi:siderophore iron [Fusarium globosum]|uniref:Siderophore iron n=1 Tax=Fusarium globosum TaxID=78864 RepID=A0A8H5Y8K0_9HYPO|nr:siderophore iron [Fusarium globosum]
MKQENATAIHLEDKSLHAHDQFDVVDKRAIGGKDVSDLPSRYFMSWQLIGSSIAFALGVGVQLGSLTMISNALYAYIDPDLGPSPNSLWITTAISLTQSVALPLYGRFSDIFGRRWFFIGGNVLVLAAMLIGAQAKSINMAIAASAISGFGGAAQLLGTIVPGELFPNKYRYVVWMVASAGLFPLVALAPGISRELCMTGPSGWRWIYRIFAIVAGISTILLLFCYHPPNFETLHKSGTKRGAIKHMDWISMLIYSASTSSLVLGLTWGSGVYSWSSAKVIVPTVMGLLGFVMMAAWGTFTHSRHPYISGRVIRNKNWAILTFIAGAGSVPYFALSILLPQQLSLVLHVSPSVAGWASCTLSGGIVLGAIIQGIFPPRRTQKLGITVKMELIACCIIFTAFMGAMADPNLTLTKAIIFCMISLTAQGIFESRCVSAASLEVNQKDVGQAHGMNMSFRTMVTAVASAIFVTTLSNTTTKNVHKYVVPAIAETGASPEITEALTLAIASGNMTAVAEIQAFPAAIEAGSAAMQLALVKSYQLLYYIGLAFGLAITITACFLSSQLIQSRLTSEIPRRLQDVGKQHQSDSEVATANSHDEK